MSSPVLPPWPARTIAECDAIMTAPGMLWELEQKVLKGRPTTVYKALPDSLRDFWEATKVFGDREYLVYETERYTYAQCHAHVQTLCELFRRRGITKGDRIAIVARNYPEWVLSFWAIHTLGAVAVAVNAWSPVEPLVHCLTNSGCKIAIVDEERAKVVEESLGRIRMAGCTDVFVMRSAGKRVGQGFESLENAMRGCEGVETPRVKIEPEDYASIFFTSGTTSLPKGVISTQRQFLSNRINAAVAGARTALRKGESLPEFDPAARPALLLSVPLFHVTGNQSLLIIMTVGGGKVVLMHKWDIKSAVEIVRKESITICGGVPNMVAELIDSELGNDTNNTLQGFTFGGAPCSSKMPEKSEQRMPNVSIATAYGLTETNAVIVAVSGRDYFDHSSSCGMPPPACEVKILDPNTLADLGRNKTGEIYLRGPNVAEGYYKNPKATKEAFGDDGWFQTGDIGHYDSEGYLYISDRAKEIIIRGGENISTVNVEDALYQDDRVRECAVVPVPDEKLGELVACVVVPKERYSGQVTESQLRAVVAKHLPKHCVPVLFVIRDELLPRNANGKTLKKELKIELEGIWGERTKTIRGKL